MDRFIERTREEHGDEIADAFREGDMYQELLRKELEEEEMTSRGEYLRLSLIYDKTKRHVMDQMKQVPLEDRKALRREFSEWFNTSYEDLDVDWMDHFDYW